MLFSSWYLEARDVADRFAAHNDAVIQGLTNLSRSSANRMAVENDWGSARQSCGIGIAPTTVAGLALIRCHCSTAAWLIEIVAAVVFAVWVLSAEGR